MELWWYTQLTVVWQRHGGSRCPASQCWLSEMTVEAQVTFIQGTKLSVQTSAAQPYTTATLMLSDAHGGDNQCSAKVGPEAVRRIVLLRGHHRPLARQHSASHYTSLRLRNLARVLNMDSACNR